MLRYFRKLFGRWVRFTNLYYKSILIVLIHSGIIISTIALTCSKLTYMGLEIGIYSLMYIFLQLIVGYLRGLRSDPESDLMKLKHKRFTEETKEGFIRTEKSRLPEMIQFVYNVEEIMEDIHEVEK